MHPMLPPGYAPVYFKCDFFKKSSLYSTFAIVRVILAQHSALLPLASLYSFKLTLVVHDTARLLSVAYVGCHLLIL